MVPSSKHVLQNAKRVPNSVYGRTELGWAVFNDEMPAVGYPEDYEEYWDYEEL